MLNFYTRNETATLLHVTPSTISKYLKSGILKNYGTAKNIKISHEEVHSFYENVKLSTKKVDMSDIIKLEKRVGTLEAEVEVLKMIVGIGTLRGPRSDEELQAFYSEIMMLLTNTSWDTKTLMYIGDSMTNLKDQEVLRLVQLKGTRAWTGLFDLSERMLHYITCMALPKVSADVLTNRLEAGRNRLYGLLYVSLSDHIAMDKFWAKRIISSRVIDKTTDEFMISFLAKRAQE